MVPTASKLGNFIRTRRLARGRSAEALAQRIGAGKPHVLKIERGQVTLLNRRTEGQLARPASVLDRQGRLQRAGFSKNFLTILSRFQTVLPDLA